MENKKKIESSDEELQQAKACNLALISAIALDSDDSQLDSDDSQNDRESGYESDSSDSGDSFE